MRSQGDEKGKVGAGERALTRSLVQRRAEDFCAFEL